MSFVRIAIVSRPHGLKGEFVTAGDSGDDSALSYLSRVFLSTKSGEPKEYSIESASLSPKGWRVALEGVTRIEEAELLRGAEILALREDLDETEDNEFYVTDLLGCPVIEEETGNEIGKLADVEDVLTPTGQKATSRWWIKTPAGDVAIPAITRFIVSVDPKEKKIIVRNMEELKDDSST
jgi:16S rRNA processing protein RimM